MKKGLLLFALLAMLTAPAMASPRDDDPRGGRDVISRIVRLVKQAVRAFEDGIVPMPPHP